MRLGIYRTLGAAVLFTIGAIVPGCLAGEADFEPSHQAENELRVRERSSFREAIDYVIRHVGEDGTACSTEDRSCVSSEALRLRRPVTVGDNHQPTDIFYLCNRERDGSLSGCSEGGLEAPVCGSSCVCNTAADCIEMVLDCCVSGNKPTCTEDGKACSCNHNGNCGSD